MSNEEDYQAILLRLNEMPDEKAQVPRIPVDVFLQEAENLCHWCQDDQEVLTNAGLAWTNYPL